MQWIFRPPNEKDCPQYEEVQRVLREEIVNPLRKNVFVRADRVMKLRTLLEKLSSVSGLTSEEKGSFALYLEIDIILYIAYKYNNSQCIFQIFRSGGIFNIASRSDFKCRTVPQVELWTGRVSLSIVCRKRRSSKFANRATIIGTELPYQ